ncbi:hypothetical protein LSAT2_017759 [Lamellibrachia satsuma]|nr:hypothetical protein LSAT2_017759 [Lamellibrachia satsuma]
MFQVRSKQRVVELLASSIEDKEAWMEAIRNAIANQETEQCTISSIKEALGMQAPAMIKVQDAPTCIRCARTFGVINMCLQHHCQACGHVKATDDSLFSGFLHASNDKKNWQRRYFAIHDDFVLYSFYDNEDSFAMTSVTLPGYVVSIVSETSIVSRENVIKLFRVGQKEVYYFKANAKRDLVRWMESLENAIQEKVLLCWQSSMLEETEC